MVSGSAGGSVVGDPHPGGGRRYYASFVVEVHDTPLPVITDDVGVDFGLTSLAVLSTGDVIENRGAGATRAGPEEEGIEQPQEAAARVAVLHRKVRETRLDGHHKLALRLIRDNQAVYVEDLAVSGLARTRLAKSVHDARRATLVRLLEEKADRCHRQVVKVGRWFPSSQLCSHCGLGSGRKPLQVRDWTCDGCGVRHDRDRNAALVEGPPRRRRPGALNWSRPHIGAVDQPSTL